jgi:CHAT domain-containing protein
MHALEGAGWVHFACHADIDTDSLVLALPDSDDPAAKQAESEAEMFDAVCAEFLDKRQDVLQQFGDRKHEFIDMVTKQRALLTSLRMDEVQGSAEEAGVQLETGATVVLSACNTARGRITAEGVVGLARGFLLAGAAATVVSLWSVDDRSTAALMEQMYFHLVDGFTVPQALRLAMLRLARRPALEQTLQSEEPSSADGLRVEWKRPVHWAGFLVMGASTRLP